MPTSITATADAGTDVITATGHGLTTGDRFRMRNEDGALPAGLAAVTTYFAIRIDGNTLKAATSSANALAGTAIDITDAGTGTHYLEAGLPYVEPRVATAGTQIYSADDNATWDSLKALHALLTGQTETVWNGAATLAGALAVAGAATLTGGATIGAPYARTGTITPTTISDSLTRNDFDPTDLATANTIRQVISGTATPALSGLAGGSDGRIIVLHALGATAGDTLQLLHEDAGSSAANRFSLASASSLTLPRNGAVTLQYDGTSSRWRVIGKNF